MPLEHQRRDLETGRKLIAAPGFTDDRNAAERELDDVPVDGAFGDLEPIGERPGRDPAPAAQQLDDREQPVGTAHPYEIVCRPMRFPSESRIVANQPIPSPMSVRGTTMRPPAA